MKTSVFTIVLLSLYVITGNNLSAQEKNHSENLEKKEAKIDQK